MSMKKKNKLIALAVVLALVGFGLVMNAQVTIPGTTPVQAVQPLYTCDQTATATGAANTAVTATLTPPSGQFVYICSIYIAVAANAAVTGAAGPAPIFTTTNLANNLVWWGTNETLGTGAARTVTDVVYPFWLKSAVTGTTFTVVTSAGQSTMNVRINITARFAQ